MNPAHEQYARRTPSNTLDQLFRMLEAFEEGPQFALSSLCLDVLDDLAEIESADDPLGALKDRCRAAARAIPEDLLVHYIVLGCSWRLFTGSEDSKLPTWMSRRTPVASRAEQRLLFPVENETCLPSETSKASLYETLCRGMQVYLLALSKQDSTQESVAFLALSEIRGVGYWTLRKLVQHGPLAGLFFLNSTEDFNKTLRAVGSKGSLDTNIPIKEWQERAFAKGQCLLAELAALGIRMVHRFDPEYPAQLNDLDDSPDWLFVQGNPAVLHQRSVAVVGTRSPTSVGTRLAAIIAASLPNLHSVLVSGLAEGIDQSMHLASLQHNVPTIAVLGTGILNTFPSGSECIRSEICKSGGAVITEYLPHDSYSSQNFVRRNRIQAGLATVVIPVEWRIKSGTAHTVRFAHETNRKIICVRPPEWKIDNRPELQHALQIGAKVFTLPDELEAFVTAVTR